MVSINGVPCHERGCLNSGARWDANAAEWVQQYTCFECGCVVDAGVNCCSNDDCCTNDDDYDEEE
jgi:hypothetical protein